MRMVDSCKQCENVLYCLYNEFESCPKIEQAGHGLGIPVKPKVTQDDSWIGNIPFGVYMCLKRLVNRKPKILISPSISVTKPIMKVNGIDSDGDVMYGKKI